MNTFDKNISANQDPKQGPNLDPNLKPINDLNSRSNDSIEGSGETRELLNFNQVEASYGNFRALFGVSFKLNCGESLALLGPNGAGKSTVVRVISGLIKPKKGKVTFKGIEIGGMSPWRIQRLGVAQVPEGRAIFSTLSVEENLKIFLSHVDKREKTNELIDEVFEFFPRLKIKRKQRGGTLSGGEQRMLAISRAIVSPPELLIADEPSIGLAPIIADEVWNALSAVKSKGVSLIVIEQHLTRAQRIADIEITLKRGEIEKIERPILSK